MKKMAILAVAVCFLLNSAGAKTRQHHKEPFVYIATVRVNSSQHVVNVLKLHGIAAGADTDLGAAGVFVASHQRSRAVAILKADVRKHGYWIEYWNKPSTAGYVDSGG